MLNNKVKASLDPRSGLSGQIGVTGFFLPMHSPTGGIDTSGYVHGHGDVLSAGKWALTNYHANQWANPGWYTAATDGSAYGRCRVYGSSNAADFAAIAALCDLSTLTNGGLLVAFDLYVGAHASNMEVVTGFQETSTATGGWEVRLNGGNSKIELLVRAQGSGSLSSAAIDTSTPTITQRNSYVGYFDVKNSTAALYRNGAVQTGGMLATPLPNGSDASGLSLYGRTNGSFNLGVNGSGARVANFWMIRNGDLSADLAAIAAEHYQYPGEALRALLA